MTTVYLNDNKIFTGTYKDAKYVETQLSEYHKHDFTYIVRIDDEQPEFTTLKDFMEDYQLFTEITKEKK